MTRRSGREERVEIDGGFAAAESGSREQREIQVNGGGVHQRVCMKVTWGRKDGADADLTGQMPSDFLWSAE